MDRCDMRNQKLGLILLVRATCDLRKNEVGEFGDLELGTDLWNGEAWFDAFPLVQSDTQRLFQIEPKGEGSLLKLVHPKEANLKSLGTH